MTATASNQRPELRFLIVPGYVTSRSDRDQHYIGVGQLVRLYQLRQGEYLRLMPGRRVEDYPYLIPLHPRYDGKYDRPVVPPDPGRQLRLAIEEFRRTTRAQRRRTWRRSSR